MQGVRLKMLFAGLIFFLVFSAGCAQTPTDTGKGPAALDVNKDSGGKTPGDAVSDDSLPYVDGGLAGGKGSEAGEPGQDEFESEAISNGAKAGDGNEVPKAEEVPLDKNTLLIASWNLQVFGTKKASDANLMDYYADKIDDYDIVFVQEIRDASGDAFKQLCGLLPEHGCAVSSRAGKSASKEQYGVIYRKADIISSLDYNDYPEKRGRFERPPLEVKFNYGDSNFTVVTIHIDPDLAVQEINDLEAIFFGRTDPVIILGDLNADCDYYGEESEGDFNSWLWVIPDTEDTTVAATECTYDRIIVNEPVKKRVLKYGVMKDVNKGQSDHYLVWGEFSAGAG